MGHGAFGQIGLLSGRAERVQNAESSNHRHSDRRQTSIRPLIMILILLTSDQCECRLSRRCFLLLNEDCNTTAHTASLTSFYQLTQYLEYPLPEAERGTTPSASARRAVADVVCSWIAHCIIMYVPTLRACIYPSGLLPTPMVRSLPPLYRRPRLPTGRWSSRTKR